MRPFINIAGAKLECCWFRYTAVTFKATQNGQTLDKKLNLKLNISALVSETLITTGMLLRHRVKFLKSNV